ncbi:two-component sensor histidine kinase [Rhizocola hellebori]|uniref:Signal transduction histidine-protein kinase/phosphatase MprB n=1 Tax=Rhizocola hellebori TaxID=1392758 RepID=A0A8J3VDG1_9ACTN|nr:HAMP domain-containing sensor histidine kinase [Rhizocola hellebori]GIH02680.1 two-component sensor histidine kinase [Rhizocola hellebori]
MTGVRAQLATLAGATTVAVLLAFLGPLGLLLRNAAQDRAIAEATQQAQSVASLVAVNPAVTPDLAATNPNSHTKISIFLPDGQVWGAPAARNAAVDLAAMGGAFTARTQGGVEVLVPVLGHAEGTVVIRAFVPDSALREGVARTWILLALLGLALCGLGVALADRLGRRLTGSVTALAATAERLASGDLSARVPPSGAAELRLVGDELNRLAARIAQLLEEARADAADLAHGLRTPVTVLRLNVESLPDGEERARLAADVDALSRAVDEVIRGARRPIRDGVRTHADLKAVAQERIDFWSALAEETGRPVTQHLPTQPVPVRASPEDLSATLDALLENVFTHTPDQAQVRISVAPLATGGGRLTIEDAGPGLATQPSEPAMGSTGLGLRIARRTAEAAGGTITIDTSPLLGARVTIDLGPPT